MKKTIALLLLFVATAALCRSANNVYRMGTSGNVPGWGPLNLAGGSAAVTGHLPAANYYPPTTQMFTNNYFSSTGYVFTVDLANATVGATYTTAGNTYTVLSTITSAGGLTELFMSGSAYSGGFTGGTLTKTSGTGDSSIVYYTEAGTFTYTLPTNPTPLYIEVIMVGGGGGGSGGGTIASPGTLAYNGGPSVFGMYYVVANGGSAGPAGPSGSVFSHGGGGGTGSIASGPFGLGYITGGSGSCGDGLDVATTSSFVSGGRGGSSIFGTDGGYSGGGLTPYGQGGAGGSFASQGTSNTGSGGCGGGAGGYVDVFISSPASSYVVSAGQSGSAGNAGVTVYAQGGSPGGPGVVYVKEYYQ